VTERVFLSGASLVLPDRVTSGHTLVLEHGRIVDLVADPIVPRPNDVRFVLPGHFIAPGFIDVHVHGLGGHDVLDGAAALATVAAMLPRHGVSAFCPTSVACSPSVLQGFLGAVSAIRAARRPVDSRVLGAHLESNFINPEYRGAQSLACLRVPDEVPLDSGDPIRGDYGAADILEVMDRHRPDVGIVTLAPELSGGLDLIRRLVAAGVRVSLGHSAATYEIAEHAIAAGAAHATHLFNRMPPITHREPGLAGAILANDAVAAELVCDGHHVHPAVLHMAIAAKGVSRVMAITDGTAGSGLPVGTRTRLGDQMITVANVARLDDGTTAGSVATMDQVFRYLVASCGIDVCDAAQLCATTPARELGLVGYGAIAKGAAADLVVLDARFSVVQTWIGGVLAWCGTSTRPEPSPTA
jgi:N-acetylglucosamine-6-phosphate deacetylase